MKFTVKSVDGPEQKSVQEIEEGLLKKQEEEVAAKAAAAEEAKAAAAAEVSGQVSGQVEKEIKEEDVLSYIKNKYNKDITSVEEILNKSAAPKTELPPIVDKFLEYQKATNGRSFDDFLKTQEDYDKKDPTSVLKDYYSLTEEGLDQEDIDYMLEEKFGYDKDIDEESVIKKKEILKKKELVKAKKYFEGLKETYKVPAESAKSSVPAEESEDYKAYKEYLSKSSSVKQENERKSQYFQQKTDELFNDNFKGFEYKVGDQQVVFSPGDMKDVKEAQSSIQNFIAKFIDSEGLIKDPVGYHKALSAALNPEKMANFFYEKGKADAVGTSSKSTKNINMSVRSAPQQFASKGFTVKAVGDTSSGRGLKIRSVK